MSEDTRRLREPSDGSGLGFCYSVDPALFRPSETPDGPLLVALDTNVIVDLLEYGERMVNGDQFIDVPEKYREELAATGWILDLWFMRDIRLLALSGLDGDHRREPLPLNASRKARVAGAIAEALFVQTDYGLVLPRDTRPMGSAPGMDRLDARLVLEAEAVGADVFLTRDERVVRASSRHGKMHLNVWTPRQLAERLTHLGIEHFAGGHISHDGCTVWQGAPLLADLTKMSVLLSAFERT